MIRDFNEIMGDVTRKYIEGVVVNPNFIYSSSYEVQHLNVDASTRLKEKNESNLEVVFVGKSRLSNTTDTTQKLTTNSFTIQNTNSITNSTTSGFNFGLSVSAKFGIFGAETQVQATSNFNFSTTNSQTNSTTMTYTANPQTIEVPPNSEVEVEVVLNRVKLVATVELIADVSGDNIINYEALVGASKNKARDVLNMGQLFKKYNQPFIKVNGDKVTFIGEGVFEVSQATTFTVSVKKIGSNDKIVEYVMNI